MPWFMVTCFRDGKAEGAYQKTEAADAREAAENVCGGPLLEGAGLNVRATVRPLDDPEKIKTFRSA
jgi:hypothetical protein